MSTTAPSSTRSVNGVLEENTQINNNGLAGTTSEAQVSPRVSTVDTDEPSGTKKDQHAFFAQEHGQEFRDYTAIGLDSLHWAGVKKRGDFDQRSVASSMNAEKDDKSIYEEPAVGAVEEAEEQLDDDDDEEVEEIVLSGGLRRPSDSMQMHIQESGPFQGDSSPRETENRMAESSVGASEADNASIRPVPSEDGELEDVSLDAMASRGNGPSRPISVPDSGSLPLPGSSAAPSSAASPRSPGLPPSPLSRTSMDFEALHGSPLRGPGSNRGGPPVPMPPADPPYRSSLMRKVTGTATSDGGEDLDTAASVAASGGSSAAPSLPDSNIREASSYGAPSLGGRSVEPPTDKEIAAAAEAAEEREGAVNSAIDGGTLEEDDLEKTAPTTKNMEPLEVENSNAQVAGTSAAAPAAAGAGVVVTAAATAAEIPEGGELPPGPRSMPKVDLGPEWEDTFKGLVYCDGVDNLGRPVVVLNADAVPPRMRSSALTYVKAHLEPIVNSGDYVIVFTARKAKLPSLWIMGAYQTLPRPYRKNVQFVILVRPSGFLKAMLAFMRPFVSKKAGRKIKAVEALEEIPEVTENEVTVASLGPAFLEADMAVQEQEVAAAAEAAAAAQATAASP